MPGYINLLPFREAPLQGLEVVGYWRPLLVEEIEKAILNFRKRMALRVEYLKLWAGVSGALLPWRRQPVSVPKSANRQVPERGA